MSERFTAQNVKVIKSALKKEFSRKNVKIVKGTGKESSWLHVKLTLAKTQQDNVEEKVKELLKQNLKIKNVEQFTYVSTDANGSQSNSVLVEVEYTD